MVPFNGMPMPMQMGPPMFAPETMLQPHGNFMPPGQGIAMGSAPTDLRMGDSRTPISQRAVPIILKWPKTHAMKCLKHLDGRFEPTMTGICDSEEIAILIWCITSIKPNFKCSDLNPKYWEELFDDIGKGQQRKKDIFCSHPIAYTSRPPKPKAAQPHHWSALVISGCSQSVSCCFHICLS